MGPTRLLFALLLASAYWDYAGRTRGSEPGRLLSVSPVLPCAQTCTLRTNSLTQAPSRTAASLPAHLSIGLMCCYALKSCFIVPTDALVFSIHCSDAYLKCNSIKMFRIRCMIMPVLMISGDVQSNPGPDSDCIQTAADFNARSGLGIIHLNVRSLLPKIDFVRVWAQTTNADIIVISESWLNKSINDNDISINGYNISRADRIKRGGGIIVYSKCRFHTKVLVKKSIPNQFEILGLQVELSKGYYITVVGCYRPPSAAKETLSSLSNILS